MNTRRMVCSGICMQHRPRHIIELTPIKSRASSQTCKAREDPSETIFAGIQYLKPDGGANLYAAVFAIIVFVR